LTRGFAELRGGFDVSIGSSWHKRRYSIGSNPAANANVSPFNPSAAAS
jgi:hypothetical protein